MRRRAFLASVGTIALAGCTASGEDDDPDPEDYTVHGLEDSDVYHDYEMYEPNLFDFGRRFSATDIILNLVFDTDAEYDPADNDVYLMDGDALVSEGDSYGTPFDGKYAIQFDLESKTLGREQTYRVVSMGVFEPFDEFDLTIEVSDRE